MPGMHSFFKDDAGVVERLSFPGRLLPRLPRLAFRAYFTAVAAANVTLRLRPLKYSIWFSIQELFRDVTFRRRAPYRENKFIQCDSREVCVSRCARYFILILYFAFDNIAHARLRLCIAAQTLSYTNSIQICKMHFLFYHVHSNLFTCKSVVKSGLLSKQLSKM